MEENSPLMPVDFYSTGTKENGIPTEYSLFAGGTVNKINLVNRIFSMSIVFSDMIEVDEFLQLLSGEKRKIVLLCTMNKDDKEYSGKRKLLWKNSSIAISQGGARIEFPREAIAMMANLAGFIKSAYNKH